MVMGIECMFITDNEILKAHTVARSQKKRSVYIKE